MRLENELKLGLLALGLAAGCGGTDRRPDTDVGQSQNQIAKNLEDALEWCPTITEGSGPNPRLQGYKSLLPHEPGGSIDMAEVRIGQWLRDHNIDEAKASILC